MSLIILWPVIAVWISRLVYIILNMIIRKASPATINMARMSFLNFFKIILFLQHYLNCLCLYKLTGLCAEVDLQHSAIWMAGLYLMLLMQFLENKVAVELTRSEFVEAQQVKRVCYNTSDWFSWSKEILC